MCQTQSDQINEIAKALAAAQAELEPAAKNAENPHLRNRYADLSAVYEAIRKVLPKHGLAVAQVMLPRDDGKAHVRTTLLHESGLWIAGECVMPCDKQGGIQGMGSAITYARRYSLSAIVGVVSEVDDDAEAATNRRDAAQRQRQQARAANPDPMTEAQSKALSPPPRAGMKRTTCPSSPYRPSPRGVTIKALPGASYPAQRRMP